MQHTLAAVFDNPTSAQQAMNELVRCGFPSADLTLTDATSAQQQVPLTRPETGEQDESFGKAVLHFFSDLFGAHHADTRVYTEAIQRGNVVLTFVTDDQDKVERAADIIEGYGPVDIDEYESQWRAGGWTGAEALRTPAYQGAGASMQSGQGGSAQRAAPQQGAMQRDSAAAPTGDVRMGGRTGQTGGVRVYSRVQQGTLPASADQQGYYQVHYTSHFSMLEGSYDDYAPAYEFGETMAGEPAYRGRNWDEVEARLRSDWESRHPGSAWERFKAAIRHGWERMTHGSVDDKDYRNHWHSHYGSLGGNYDEYAPAYRYGSVMASSSNYRGSNWDEVEAALRSDWEARYPGSAWDRFKAAVRHGWDRITD